ncbi:winged helix-turn-helix domain-containing protein [Lysobacter sp. Root494]|uniref:protein kinase domain-containing protein n=1 Tax=Lysobacter sp. Root494 TaxID=1736549 RepID=UPI000A8406D4|nr:winged helix-turn-helix domain-containing protein [Lysobacter sp. Root494]
MANDSANGPVPLQPGLWRFGTVLLDEQVAALRVGDVPVDLDRSSYDVLLALLRHAGEVVTKDELLEAGWPGRVVSENSLAKAISRLRQALGEDGDLIRVVHGYGYRLAAAVSCQPVADDRAPAHPHEASRLHEGDPVPHRQGWRLVRRLGEGSSGVIFLARSGGDEEHPGEERAIKFATSEAGLRSLKREVSLARYIRAVKADVPDVASVIGWNLSRPPFFLELPHFAAGHLADWAHAANGLSSLPVNARITLCAQLCETVAGLHEIGVIHKDLKPENLYPCVDTAGRWHVVLADLGAGEAMQSPRLAELGITLSVAADQLSQRAGSLLYLAPEVIAGEMPTQRSDIFALGVLAYQIVVGDLRRPLAPGWEADIDDELLREDIALAAASNPARRDIDARSLAQRLRTLDIRREQRERNRRHAAVAEHQGRQLAALKQRRRWLLAGMAVLSAFLVLSLWQQYRLQNARRATETASRRAHENAATADAVNRFFNQDVLGAASPYAQDGNHEPTVREAIDHAVARIDERLRDQPVVEATVRMTIGQVYGEAMQIAKAIEQERRAVALFEKHLGRDDPRTQQARYRLATDLTDNSRFDEAKKLIDETNALRARHGLTDLETTLLSHRASCYWHIWREQYDAGQPACEGVIATQLALDPADRNALIKARANLAVLHSRAGRFAQAEEQFMRIEQEFAALGDHDSPTRLRFSYLHGMNLLELARYDEATRTLDAAHRGSVASLGADNPHTLEVEMGLARLHVLRGQPAQAVPLLQHAYATYARQLGKDNHYTVDARRALDKALCAGTTASPTPACP